MSADLPNTVSELPLPPATRSLGSSTITVSPMAWSPLAGGQLLSPQCKRELAVAAALDAFAAEHDTDRATAAYSWLMAHPAGIVPIIGSQNPRRIAEAVRATQIRWNRKDWYAVLVASREAKLP